MDRLSVEWADAQMDGAPDDDEVLGGEPDAPHGTGCACEDCPDYDGLTEIQED
jgi:hypothetical protein